MIYYDMIVCSEVLVLIILIRKFLAIIIKNITIIIIKIDTALFKYIKFYSKR